MIDRLNDPGDIVAVAGDWHGQTAWAMHAVDYACLKGARVVVQVGDFGLWPGPGGESYLRKLNKQCRESSVDVIWVPGNHENYDRIERMEAENEADPFITMDQWGYERIHYAPRGARWEWWGKRFMAVGGAISVDRNWREEGKSYWPAEVVTDANVEYANREPVGMDVIFTHDCPRGVPIPGIGPDSKQRPDEMAWPVDAMYDSQLSRNKMREIWEAHRPKLWYHGHFHIDYEAYLGDTKIIGIDRDDTKMVKNVKFFTKEDLK